MKRVQKSETLHQQKWGGGHFRLLSSSLFGIVIEIQYCFKKLKSVSYKYGMSYLYYFPELFSILESLGIQNLQSIAAPGKDL